MTSSRHYKVYMVSEFPIAAATNHRKLSASHNTALWSCSSAVLPSDTGLPVLLSGGPRGESASLSLKPATAGWVLLLLHLCHSLLSVCLPLSVPHKHISKCLFCHISQVQGSRTGMCFGAIILPTTRGQMMPFNVPERAMDSQVTECKKFTDRASDSTLQLSFYHFRLFVQFLKGY